MTSWRESISEEEWNCTRHKVRKEVIINKATIKVYKSLTYEEETEEKRRGRIRQGRIKRKRDKIGAQY